MRKTAKVKIVFGPPCSGKSTYVNENKGENDLLYDYDDIMTSLSGLESHSINENLIEWVVDIRNLLIDKLHDDTRLDNAFIITTFIKDDLVNRLSGLDVEYVRMTTSKEICLERLEACELRLRKEELRDVIERWFEEYGELEEGGEENLKKGEKTKYWDFKAAANGVGELFIYGSITHWVWDDDDSDTSASSFKKDLDALGDITTLNLYINSPGGSVFEGVAIYNILKRHKAKINVHIDALAASIASVIAMAGDTVTMPSNAMMMIHNPWTYTWGNASELRKEADNLDRIGTSMKQSYLDRTGDKLDDAKLTELLDAETWLSAQECLEYGLCDVVGDENQAAACISDELFAKYRNVPKAITEKSASVAPPSIIDEKQKEYLQSIKDSAKVEIQNLNSYLGGI